MLKTFVNKINKQTQNVIFAKKFIIKKTKKMKKIKILALALIATAITFSSCTKDEETKTGPGLTITADKTSVWLGDSVVVSYNITSNEKIQKLNWSASLAGVTSDMYETTDFNGDYLATGTVVFHVTTVEEDLNGATSVKLTFTAEDKDGVEFANTKELTIAIEDDTMTLMTDEHTNGIISNFEGPNQGAWDLVLNEGVSSPGGSTTVNAEVKDMRNTTTDAETFVVGWEAMNSTMFVKDNAFSYADASVEGAMAAYAAGSAVSTVSGVTTGDVYIAKLRGGDDYAVILITDVVVTDGDNADKINFSYKK